MTISEEESNLFCACQLLNCDEGQGHQSQAFGTKYGARQNKKE
jgi:hypothetical protein